MKEFNCSNCGRALRPCPAKSDGEPVFIGYYPCVCSKPFFDEAGIIEPGTEEHERILKDYDKRIPFYKV